MTSLACSACFDHIELYASDGGDPYRTGDTPDRCAECASGRACACCGEWFACDDPSDPDNQTCPKCAADVVPVTCDHVNSTCATCERH